MFSNKELAPCATFICGHRKSGTTLLASLLDNHPEVMTVPSDSGFFYKYYPAYNNEEHTLEEKRQRVLEGTILPFEDFLNTIEKDSSFEFSMKDMEKIFLEHCKNSKGDAKDMLLAMVMAYRDASPLDKSRQKRWVEKTTSTEIYAGDIKEWFSEAKFIHVIRDPRDNYGSLKSGWEKRYQQFNDSTNRLLQSHIERGKLGMELAMRNQERFGKESYLVIKFEELGESPEKVMRDIARFLDISFDESLLKPTVWGFPWGGNNFEGEKFTGISKVNINRWRERITPEEASLIEFYYGDIMKHFGYEQAFSSVDQADAAVKQYKWHNYAQIYST